MTNHAAPEQQRRGLGRGLEVLIGGTAEPELAHLPVETIHPNPRQPRRRFDAEATTALADSIKVQGIVQPVLVRPRPAGGFELIAGERRWRAAKQAGTPTVPAPVAQTDDCDTLVLGPGASRPPRSTLRWPSGFGPRASARQASASESQRRGSSSPSLTNTSWPSSPRRWSGSRRAVSPTVRQALTL